MGTYTKISLFISTLLLVLLSMIDTEFTPVSRTLILVALVIAGYLTTFVFWFKKL